jgi:hypothetical protein
MKKSFEEIVAELGFDSIYSSLCKLFALITLSSVIATLRDINARTLATITEIKKATAANLKPLTAKLAAVLALHADLFKADTEVEAIRTQYGFRKSDMHYTVLNFLLSPAFLGGAAIVILVDFLLGGVIVFHSNQSWLTTILLLSSAIGAAFLWSAAAPAFAIRKRIYTEIQNANRQIATDLKAAKSIVTDAKLLNIENYLPIWLRPSKQHIGHDDANVFQVDAIASKYGVTNHGKTIKLWKAKKSMWVPVGALLMGLIFGALRFIPVLAMPKMYGEGALMKMFWLFLIAMAVNAVVFFVEKSRRKAGLPTDLQKIINVIMKKRNDIAKETGEFSKLRKLQKRIKKFVVNANNILSRLKGDYNTEFDNEVNAGVNDNFVRDKQAYITLYSEHNAKGAINTFLTAISEYPEYVEMVHHNMPAPTIVNTIQPVTKDSLTAMKLPETDFTISESDFIDNVSETNNK